MEDPADPAAPPDEVRPYRSRLRAAAALSLPVLGFWLPFFGIFTSLVIVLLVVPRAAPRLWGRSRGGRAGVALLGFGAMWLPAVVAFSGVFYSLFGEAGADRVGSTAWLLIPLCAPEQPLMPTVVASAVYVAGAALSGAVHRPWPWVLGALLSALSYDLVMSALSIDVVC